MKTQTFKKITLKGEFTNEQLIALCDEIVRVSEFIGLQIELVSETVFDVKSPERVDYIHSDTPIEELIKWSETASKQSIVDKAKELLKYEKAEMYHFFITRAAIGVKRGDDDNELFERIFEMRYRSGELDFDGNQISNDNNIILGKAEKN